MNSKPTSFNASKFYELTDLYPYKDRDVIDDEKFDPNHDSSYLVISEKDQNNELNQYLIKSQDHHLLIIEFIKKMKVPP